MSQVESEVDVVRNGRRWYNWYRAIPVLQHSRGLATFSRRAAAAELHHAFNCSWPLALWRAFVVSPIYGKAKLAP
jgi:hypothetical protein